LIEAIVGLQLRLDFIRDVALRTEKITRRQRHHEERDRRQEEQDRDDLQKTTDDRS
jgi:hypothetical protein